VGDVKEPAEEPPKPRYLPRAYRPERDMFGYRRVDDKNARVPGYIAPDSDPDPSPRRIREVCRDSLLAEGLRVELGRHATIHTIGELARAMEHNGPGALVQYRKGSRAFSDRMERKITKAFGSDRWKSPTLKEDDEVALATEEIRADQRRREIGPYALEISALLTSPGIAGPGGTVPGPTPAGRSEGMPATLADIQKAAAAPVVAGLRKVCLDHRQGNWSIEYRIDLARPEWGNNVDCIDGDLIPETQECLATVWLSSVWLTQVHQPGYALLDGHLILRIHERDSGGRPTVVEAPKVTRESTAVVDWGIREARAEVRWDDDQPSLSWLTGVAA